MTPQAIATAGLSNHFTIAARLHYVGSWRCATKKRRAHPMQLTQLMQPSQSLIAELENTLNSGTGAQRSDILRRITDLFVQQADDYSTEQVGLFDDVIGHLIRKIERAALIELSDRLAPIDNAPRNVVGQLARNDDIAVAAPILENSSIPTDDDLVEIAKTRSQYHLLAIAGRTSVGVTVTDVLVDRGNAAVLHKVTGNHGAHFSSRGFARITSKAEQDANLAAAIAARRDVPPSLFDELVLKATETVRQRIMVTAAPEVRERVTQTLSSIARQVTQSEARRSAARSGVGSGARTLLRDPRRLRADLAECIKARSAPETIATFAALCEIPAATVRNLIRLGAEDGMLILGKAAELGWPEMKDVLTVAMPKFIEYPDDEKALFEKFITLSPANAQRALRFIKVTKGVSKDDIRKML